MDIMLLGALLRMLQATSQAASTVVIGILVAAIFQRMMGRELTWRVFGSDTWRQLPQAWAMGMLLPVCSLGAIPLMSEMRRTGIVGGTILAFGLTAPLFNPISVLYGLTLSDPIAILTFCMCSLAIVTLMGSVWDWFFPGMKTPLEPLPPVPYGRRRLLAVLLAMVRMAYSKDTLLIGVGIVGVGLLGLLLPAGYLQTSAEHDDSLAPLKMALVAVPVYATPMVAMVQLASMFQHGNSVAAAFTLLVLGTGLNLGMMWWIVGNFRWRRGLMWLASLILVVLAFGYAVDGPLYPKGVEPAGHTHAFDNYCAPYLYGAAGARADFVKQATEILDPRLNVALYGWVLLIVAGGIAHCLDPDRKMEKWLERPQEVLKNDIVLPGWVVGTVAIVGLIVASIAGCYMYYPERKEIMAELRIVNTDVFAAAVSGDWDTGEYWIPVYEDWLRKLQVSAALRNQPLTPYQQAKLKVLQERIELLEHALEDKDKDEASDYGRKLGTSYLRFTRAFEAPREPIEE